MSQPNSTCQSLSVAMQGFKYSDARFSPDSSDTDSVPRLPARASNSHLSTCRRCNHPFPAVPSCSPLVPVSLGHGIAGRCVRPPNCDRVCCEVRAPPHVGAQVHSVWKHQRVLQAFRQLSLCSSAYQPYICRDLLLYHLTLRVCQAKMI